MGKYIERESEIKFTYSVKWSNRGVESEQMKEICERIYNVCKKVLVKYFSLVKDIDLVLQKTDRSGVRNTLGSTVYNSYDNCHYIFLNYESITNVARGISSIFSTEKVQLDLLVSTILHEFCHMFQWEQCTYPNSQEILRANREKYDGKVPYEIYENYPWEVEARDFEKTFTHTAEYRAINAEVKAVLAELEKVNKNVKVTSCTDWKDVTTYHLSSKGSGMTLDGDLCVAAYTVKL